MAVSAVLVRAGHVHHPGCQPGTSGRYAKGVTALLWFLWETNLASFIYLFSESVGTKL